jgi:hypothetical protein
LAALGPHTHFHIFGLKAVKLIWACHPWGRLGLNPFGPLAKLLFMFTDFELDNRMAIAATYISPYTYVFIYIHTYVLL